MSKTAETREDAGIFHLLVERKNKWLNAKWEEAKQGLVGSCYMWSFSLNGEMLELSVHQKPKKLFYTAKKRNGTKAERLL